MDLMWLWKLKSMLTPGFLRFQKEESQRNKKVDLHSVIVETHKRPLWNPTSWPYGQ